MNLYVGDNLAAYGFPDGHPLGIDRQGAFLREATKQGLVSRTTRRDAREASRDELLRFHSDDYVNLVLPPRSAVSSYWTRATHRSFPAFTGPLRTWPAPPWTAWHR